MPTPETELERLDFRRSLRRNATDAETKLWWLLRHRRFGAKFRRQHPVGPYVLDFYCAERKLAIEVDGGQHYEPGEMRRDACRTAFLEREGIRVVRFTNYEVLGESDVVVRVIWEALHDGDRAGR